MVTIQEQIALAMKLGGKIIWVLEDEDFASCPLLAAPLKWAILPWMAVEFKQSHLILNMLTDRDCLISSTATLEKLLEQAPSLKAARVSWEADANKATLLLEYQIDALILESEIKSDIFWEEVLKIIKVGQSLPEVAGAGSRPCLFLDRDDVVIKDVPYAKNPETVELLPGVAELINEAHKQNYWVALVTNQSGLGRGWIDWESYQKVHQRMLQLLADNGAYFDDYEFSPYIKETDNVYGKLLPSLRKPRSGMFWRVQDKLKVDIKNSIMIGDSATDLVAARNFGISKLYLLKSHKSEKQIAELIKYFGEGAADSYELLESFDSKVLV